MIEATVQRRASRGLAWYILKRNPLSLVGFAIVLMLMILAVFAPWLVPYDPEAPNMARRFSPPSRAHPMGTDHFGMDILSRVIYAARIDMTIAIGGVSVALVVGCLLGAIAGYYGGPLDNVLMRILDSQQAFPTFILAMVVATALGRGLTNVIFVIAFVDFPTFARLVRAGMIVSKHSMYSEAAKCVGNPNYRIMLRHLLPNCLGPIYVTSSLLVGGAVMLTATLSFLGLGVRAPMAEWGLMVADGSRYLVSGYWWISLFPGFMVWLCMFGWNLLGDGLQDILDPKRR